jgi:hypothetical protein
VKIDKKESGIIQALLLWMGSSGKARKWKKRQKKGKSIRFKCLF